MKRTLSLILAVVMVALMIPFAAITSVAASDVLYSMDFTEWGAANANAVTEVNGKLTMPDGWESTPDNDATLYNSISDKGLFLGGAAQGFGMNYIPETNGAYVIKFQWQTEHKIGLLRFGFTQGDKPLSLYVNKGYEYMATMAFPYQAGPTNNNAMTANFGQVSVNGTKYNTYETGGVIWHANERWGAGDMGNNFTRTTEIYDKNGNAVDQLTAKTHLSVPATRGDLFTTYIFVGEDKIVDKVTMEVDGLRYEYMAPINVSANGRFGIWITNDGGATSATFKSVSFIDNSDNDFAYPAIGLSENERQNREVVYNYNFGDAKTIADIPAVVLDGAKADAVLRDGALYLETAGALDAQTVHNDTAFILPNEYLPESGNYTLEYVLDGDSYANYIFSFWTNDDYSDNNVKLTEYLNLSAYFNEGIKGNQDNLTANKGVVNAVGVAGNSLPEDIIKNRAGNDIKIQLIVVNNVFRYGYISILSDGEIIASAHYGQTGNGAIAKDAYFAIILRNAKDYGASVGIKSMTVIDGLYLDLDTTDYSATNVEDIVAATTLTAGATSYNPVAQGIRFTTAIDADDFQTLVDLYDAEKVDRIEVGTLITTEAWADAAGAVTFAALDTAVGESGKTAYVAVMATIGDFYDGNVFAGSIGNAKAERTYVAVGFAKVTIGEEVIYVYSTATTATLASVQG